MSSHRHCMLWRALFRDAFGLPSNAGWNFSGHHPWTLRTKWALISFQRFKMAAFGLTLLDCDTAHRRACTVPTVGCRSAPERPRKKQIARQRNK